MFKCPEVIERNQVFVLAVIVGMVIGFMLRLSLMG